MTEKDYEMLYTYTEFIIIGDVFAAMVELNRDLSEYNPINKMLVLDQMKLNYLVKSYDMKL